MSHKRRFFQLCRTLPASAGLLLLLAGPGLPADTLAAAGTGSNGSFADDPLGVIRYWEGRIKEIVNAPTYKGTAEEKETLLAQIRTILDTERMGRLSLAQHWSRLTGEQRGEFTRLFTTLVERASVTDRKVDLFKLDGVKYKPPKTNGGDAEVRAYVRPKNEQVDVEITYRLHRASNGWRIYDLAIDEASMIEGFRAQFHKIITEQSAAELLNRLRSKVNQDL
ncbi:MAG: ABC transporter substrate-binding protein [Nitrospirae bacterium]|nr:ABC transporter substrate-binding protein [Nitrospirota bacterium]